MRFALLEYEAVNKTTSKVGISEFEIIAAILAACIIAALPQKVRECGNLRIGNNTALRPVISGSVQIGNQNQTCPNLSGR